MIESDKGRSGSNSSFIATASWTSETTQEENGQIYYVYYYEKDPQSIIMYHLESILSWRIAELGSKQVQLAINQKNGQSAEEYNQLVKHEKTGSLSQDNDKIEWKRRFKK
ncbi:UNKNOWN [Stylonychia lemnae]|uniref:Uncharacterized protein n=1 Tax=Stylonychia lemnae TaxID=5949 RepID=A0A077ZW46_STYLE|nr:UNKNOWN [Stylonychia lemnae]|eukprot:CDW72671.1 UNKNOWN [Stylonychia lemnae]